MPKLDRSQLEHTGPDAQLEATIASAEIAFLGWHGSLPLGVAILLAAVGGGLITFLAGTARIYQLRHAAKKNLIAGR